MSYIDYLDALELLKTKKSPKAHLMAAMRAAQGTEQLKLQRAFGTLFDEMVKRQNTKDGKLPSDSQ